MDRGSIEYGIVFPGAGWEGQEDNDLTPHYNRHCKYAIQSRVGQNPYQTRCGWQKTRLSTRSFVEKVTTMMLKLSVEETKTSISAMTVAMAKL